MRDHYLDPYREAVAKSGASDYRVTLWASQRSQQLRFAVFSQMSFLAGKRILDAGCSRGDFADYLLTHDIQFDRYVGVDGLPDVIEVARRCERPRCKFHCGDFVTDPTCLSIGSPQVICISGALNTMSFAEVMQVLEEAWRATSETLLFNFLSDRCWREAGRNQYPARRHATLKLLDWAMSQTPGVAFRQDYFSAGHDAAILMRKPHAPDANRR